MAWIDSFLSGRTQRVLVEGEASDDAPVLSGVPQGSVLGPLLFLVYINDLPECVRSPARLFADDTLIYHHIRSPEDVAALQADLDSLMEWEERWGMSFNPSKCEVLHVTNKRNTIPSQYSLHGQILSVSKAGKYLGAYITPNLCWNKQVNTITHKANYTRAFLQHNLKKCPQGIREQGYKTLVRPIVEYASVIWDPYTQAATDKIEMVQRRAARFVMSDYRRTSSVADMLEKLGWETLAKRRTAAKLAMFYKMVYGLVELPPTDLVRSPRGEHKFIQPACRIDCYKYSFIPSATRAWNRLPPSTAMAPTLDLFKEAVGSGGRRA